MYETLFHIWKILTIHTSHNLVVAPAGGVIWYPALVIKQHPCHWMLHTIILASPEKHAPSYSVLHSLCCLICLFIFTWYCMLKYETMAYCIKRKVKQKVHRIVIISSTLINIPFKLSALKAASCTLSLFCPPIDFPTYIAVKYV